MWAAEASTILLLLFFTKFVRNMFDSEERLDRRRKLTWPNFLDLHGRVWAWRIDEKRVIYLRFELMKISSIIKKKDIMTLFCYYYLLYIYLLLLLIIMVLSMYKDNKQTLMKILTPVAPPWCFLQNQHEQCHKTGIFLATHFHQLSPCLLSCSSIFVQNEHL